jgi:hypothetical protein
MKPFGYGLKKNMEPEVRDMLSDLAFIEMYNKCRPFIKQ